MSHLTFLNAGKPAVKMCCRSKNGEPGHVLRAELHAKLHRMSASLGLPLVRSTLVFVLTFCVSTAFAAEVYRSVDSQGNVVYSDRPEDGAIPVTIRTARVSAPVRAPRAADDAQAANEPSEATVQAAEAAQTAEDRAANCTAARERNERYSVSHRLYRVGSNGEREYLSDAEIDTARNEAVTAIARWCD
jgi:hypothetical protein